MLQINQKQALTSKLELQHKEKKEKTTFTYINYVHIDYICLYVLHVYILNYIILYTNIVFEPNPKPRPTNISVRPHPLQPLVPALRPRAARKAPPVPRQLRFRLRQLRGHGAAQLRAAQLPIGRDGLRLRVTLWCP